jgi:hypothetical protein
MRRISTRRHAFGAAGVAMPIVLVLLAVHPSGAQGSGSVGASILGDVTSSRDSQPVVGAQVRLPAEGRAVVSDSLGRFRVAGLAAGTHALVVRRLGYSPVSAVLTVGALDSLFVSVVLDERSHELETVITRASSASMKGARVEFEQRRRMGVGKFIDAQELVKESGEPLRLAIQRRIPGVWPVYDPSSMSYHLASKRGPAGRALTSTTPCYVQVYLDGARVAGPDQGDPWDIDLVPPEMIEGMEYFDAAGTPGRYRGNGSDCGTLLLWTK